MLELYTLKPKCCSHPSNTIQQNTEYVFGFLLGTVQVDMSEAWNWHSHNRLLCQCFRYQH